ncbi:cystathionine gamma-synthase [Colletotrichum tofieldiae]|nr:cystathionine gamma-synthase [Colletotrichum tofieldiae]
MPALELGQSIPPDTAHANVGYEEGESWVVNKMTTGYPRFFIHRSILALAEDLVSQYARTGQKAMLFPTLGLRGADAGVLDFGLDISKDVSPLLRSLAPTVSAVVYSPEVFPIAKQYWQHTGDGVSSRRAEFCHGLLKEGLLAPVERPGSPVGKVCRGPKRYHRPSSIDDTKPATHHPADKTNPQSAFETQESLRFLEERFGRNLDLSLVERAKCHGRRHGSEHQLAAPISDNSRNQKDLQESDVYLFPCGMNAIFNAHQAMLRARGDIKSVNFGFPYVDTLKILQKFGPGCLFYGHASEEDLDDLEKRLETGERFLALFCEFPGNPLLTCPNLARIRSLADRYDFGVVVDETIGSFINIDVLQYADIVVSSLTKIFSGDCNVMGGSAILNPSGKFYQALKSAWTEDFEDTYWPEDVVFMERNSRDFASRIERINTNSETICNILSAHPLVKRVFYPKVNPTRPNYELCKLPGGGYGGLLSVTFHKKAHAIAFFDTIETAKGPSLGTNFTLTSPYVLLAHYQELDWAAGLGVDPDLIRVSVGLEETDELRKVFIQALEAAEKETDV